jgi:hypothetical protein
MSKPSLCGLIDPAPLSRLESCENAEHSACDALQYAVAREMRIVISQYFGTLHKEQSHSWDVGMLEVVRGPLAD